MNIKDVLAIAILAAMIALSCTIIANNSGDVSVEKNINAEGNEVLPMGAE